MTIDNFIKEALEKLHNNFPNSKLEYQYKLISDTHFIKISPKYLFTEDTFIDIDFDLNDKFRELDFHGSLCFLNEDSLVELDTPSIVFEPKAIEADSYSAVLEILENSFSSELVITNIKTQQPQLLEGATSNELDVACSKFAMAA